MADFPTTIFDPRTIENIPGVTYDANDTKRFFAEDWQNLANEVVAIETTLGTTKTAKYILYGSYAQSVKFQWDDGLSQLRIGNASPVSSDVNLLIASVAPIIEFQDTDITKRWFAGSDGAEFFISEDGFGSSSRRIRLPNGGGVAIGTNTVPTGSVLHLAPVGASSGLSTGGMRITHATQGGIWDILVGGSSNSFPGGFTIAGSGNANNGFVITASTYRLGIGTTTPADKLDVVGGISRRAGTGTARAKVPGTLYTNVTQVDQSGATVADLMTYTLPANSLAEDGDCIRVKGTGYANGAGSHDADILFNFASSFLGVIPFDAGAAGLWDWEIWITRTSSTTIRYTWVIYKSQAFFNMYSDDVTFDPTVSNLIRFRGDGDHASVETSQYIMRVDYLPAGV